MPFNATAVANEFLKIARNKGEAITSMKLQKLVFYAHGWSLALAHEPLIFNRIEAWDYGPVIPDLYQVFKAYGNEPITAPGQEWVARDRKLVLITPTLEKSPKDNEHTAAQGIVERVWQQYGKYTAARLSNATHAPGTPWEQVYKPGERNILIPNPIIQAYFERLVHAQ
ncbi:MAG: Panacea domain-containing protein [Terracidiphilus sp.]